MDILLRVSPNKETGDRTRQRKQSSTSARMKPMTAGRDEATREQVVGDNDGNCGKCKSKGCKLFFLLT